MWKQRSPRAQYEIEEFSNREGTMNMKRLITYGHDGWRVDRDLDGWPVNSQGDANRRTGRPDHRFNLPISAQYDHGEERRARHGWN